MKTVIEMAREAGFAIDVSTDPNSPPSWWGAGHKDRFKTFAEIVRADEREACAQIVETPVGEYEVVVACGGDPAQRRIPMYLSWNQAADVIRARSKT